MFELIAEAASLNPAALGGGLSPVILVALAALRASQKQEVDDLTKKVSTLRKTLRRERRRRSPIPAIRFIRTPTVKETIDRTARTIDDTCRKLAKAVEELPAARARKPSPRKRKNTETIETAESPTETPSE